MTPLPLRVSFLAPTLTMPAPNDPRELPAALLLQIVVFEHLVRHPGVAVTDAEDVPLAEEGAVLSARHPRFADVARDELTRGRRDEVLWFEIGFEAPGRTSVRLQVQRPRGERVAFDGAGPTLSASMGTALQSWLASRKQPPAPRPLPPFTDQELLAVAHNGRWLLDAASANPGGAPPNVPRSPILGVALQRFIGIAFQTYTHDAILAMEPDNPYALRDQHLARWHDHGAPRTELAQVFHFAPCWAKPHSLVWGDDVDAADRLYHASLAATLAPGNPHVLVNYGGALWEAGRRDEAARVYDRAASQNPLRVDVFHRAMDARRDLGGQPGAEYFHPLLRTQHVERLVEDGVCEDSDTDVAIVRLCMANALFDIGRLDDAIAQRERALASVPNRHEWVKMQGMLEAWRGDPDVFIHAWGREAWFRADYARASACSARAPIDTDFDQLSQLIESLTISARPRAALLAWAQYSRRGPGASVFVAPSAACALLANDLFEPAMDVLLQARLRAPGYPIAPRILRAVRLAALAGVEAWGAYVAKLESRGARRLARLVARDASDFVPGACHHAAIARAVATIGRPTTAEDVARAVHGLRAALTARGAASLEAIDALFPADATRTAADTMVAAWTDVVLTRPKAEDPSATRTQALRLLYVVGASLCRYFGGTTQIDGVLDGACRVVATEALYALDAMPRVLIDEDLRPLFVALEPFLAQDPWHVDPWLRALERSLSIEDVTAGRLHALVGDLPHTASLMRGDEGLAAELRALRDAPRAGNLALAEQLGERATRVLGGNQAIAWIEAAIQVLPPDAALDALWTAYYAHPCHGLPAIELAKRIMSSDPEMAFGLLCERLGWSGGEYKTERLAPLRTQWPASLGVPFDLASAKAHAQACMQAGRFPEALRALRWADALDASDGETLRALGMVHAQLGDAFRSVACFSEDDATAGPIEAARCLTRAGHGRAAARVYAYAALVASTPAEKAECARSAGTPEDRGPAAALWARLDAGDVEGVRAAAARGTDAATLRVALAAHEQRTGQESAGGTPPGCLELVRSVLRSTAGAADPEAALARIHALRIREQALLGFDPKPPLGRRPTDAELERGYADRKRARDDRGGAIVSALQSGGGAGVADPVVFPGMAVASLGQYVAIVRGMQSGDFAGTLSRAGIDMGTYAQVAGLWGQRLASDPQLHARFTQMLMGH